MVHDSLFLLLHQKRPIPVFRGKGGKAYRKEGSKTAPVRARGGIYCRPTADNTDGGKSAGQSIPGPQHAAQVTLIRWAMGHIPSTRRMGEMTTPRATIIERNTSWTCLFLLILFPLFCCGKGATSSARRPSCGAFSINKICSYDTKKERQRARAAMD